jgi:hypothetical protein
LAASAKKSKLTINRRIMDFRKVILGLIIIISIGCETNEISINKMYLKEIIDPTCYKDQFEYEGGQLISFKRIFGEKVSTITKFKYQNNLLIQIESESENGRDYLIDIEYNSNGQRIRETNTFTHFKNFTHEPYKITSISNFNYDASGQLITKYSTFSDSEYSFPTKTEFEWNKGNLVKMNFSYFNDLGEHSTGSKSFFYDDKRNYSNQDLALVYVTLVGQETVLSKNNLIKTTEIFFNQTIDRGSYEFSYNSNGYPIDYKYKVDNQQISSIQIKYE